MSTEQRKHEVVRGHLLGLLQEAAPNDRLPTERELTEALGVSRLTVRRALDQLVSESRVYRVQGAGTFVAEPSIRKSNAFASFSEDMMARGLLPSAQLLTAELTVAGAHHSWKLGVSPGERLVRIDRLRLTDGVPMCLESVHVVERLVPGLLDQSLDGSLYDLLSKTYGIVIERAEQTVTATVLDAADARHLAVPPLSPALQVERVTYDEEGHSIELARSLYRGDRYSFEATLHRQPS
ncbi:GntR family transcriptional regulator [Streptomyces sp. NPDC000880]